MTFYQYLRPIIFAISALIISSNASAGTLGVFTSDEKGFNTHTYYYDDGKEVTVFDTQFVPSLTEAMIKQIKSETASPITRVIVTHPNPDKFNGLSTLHALGANSIASKATANAMQGVHDYKKYYWVKIAKAFNDKNYPSFEAIQNTFEGQKKITLKSGETLTLTELKNAGVSSTQTVIRIDNTGDLIVGDLIHYKAHAWLEGGIIEGKPMPNLKNWISAVEELPALGTAKVYSGRGEVGSVTDVVNYQVNYLKMAEKIVENYIASAKKDELLDSTKSQAHYAKIQTEFEKAFPSSSLSYLIGYGVYGLVNSLIN